MRRFLPLAIVLALAVAPPPDDLDAFIQAQMSQHQINGLSLAVIQDGRIEARAYGVTARGGAPVTAATLFQAGSISKPVAATGALKLVELGKLALDDDVNATLKSWRVPANELTRTEKVTLRRLLSHSAGLTVHGFPGYAVTERMPSLVQVLDGAGNTAPIRVDVVPGSIWRYSGGGYTVMQQLVVDVSGKSFPEYMTAAVLAPLGMTSSTYQQPLPADRAAQTASGHYADRSAVSGKWHVYPEMAAAGLWTTPTDLARFAIEVQQSLAGKSNKVLSQAMTRQQLTAQKGDFGLGLALSGSGAARTFSHNGRDEGFDALMTAFAETGQGLVVMINANDNSGTMNRIVEFVAGKYKWPQRSSPAPAAAKPLAPAPPFKVIGYYADWTAARYPLSGIPAEKLTHVNYAFAKIGADNRLTVKTELFDQITALKQKHPHLKFILSVGGWTDSGPFYEMAAGEDSRQAFAASCAEFLKTYPQFDGIDLDWEHPVIGGVQPGQPRDAQNYVLLLAAVRKAIGPGRLLTIAVSASPRGIEPLAYAEMVPFLDWVSPMTYDFHTGGPRTGFNSALYNHDDPSNPKLNLHDAVQALIAKGVPRDRLAAGVAFFARGWRGVETADPWSSGTGSLPVGGYKAIAETFLKAPAYVRHWDDVAKVPWLYNAATKEWISYDDPESIRLKGEYIAAQKLAGAMFWELSHDDGPLLDALRAGLQPPR